MVDLTRRSFLKGLAGTAVIVALPKIITPLLPAAPAEAVPPPQPVLPPDGITYNWVRTSLLGEPDIENMEARIANGWTFVKPSAHPELPVEDAAVAFERQGLILMQRPTVDCYLDGILEQFMGRDKLSQSARLTIFNLGYVVTKSGAVLDLDGKPYTGDVLPEHAMIAEERRTRRGSYGDA